LGREGTCGAALGWVRLPDRRESLQAAPLTGRPAPIRTAKGGWVSVTYIGLRLTLFPKTSKPLSTRGAAQDLVHVARR
jgi:hypothetical protein